MQEVRRTNLYTDLYTDISLEQAMAELVRQDTQKERGRVLVSLCEGNTLETETHSYNLL